mgnify:CR=1 FL=1
MRYVLFILLIVMVSCKKESTIINNNNGDFVRFSIDTLLFDTVFTTIGSTTRYFKVYNDYNDDITINSIALAKGDNSSFILNIDGEANHNIENTLLRNGDSLYIFAEVTIDPNGANNPLIETDSIIFTYNNLIQDVDLVAWGRDAYFHSSVPDFQQGISSNLDSMLYSDFFNSIPDELMNQQFYYYSINQHTQWTNDKPHVIYGDVIVEDGATLEIQQGAEIYLHNNAWLVIDSLSSLHSIGTLSMPIIYQSDRTDSHSIIDYANTPGQWGKIWMLPGSTNNILEYTILKNGKIGLHIDGVNNMIDLPQNPTLTIKNSIIYNMSEIGLLAQGTKVYGENLLIANCGIHLLGLNIGGDYTFKHCTFANFWPFSSRQTPSVFLNNYYEDGNGSIQNRDLIKAYFGNCIIDGSNPNEVFFDQSSDALFNFEINSSLLKLDSSYWTNWNHSLCTDNILSDGINFADYEILDFQLDSLSNAVNSASPSIALEVPFDINGISRTNNPDMGCFETIE